MVIDASLTLSWYFADEITPAAEAVLDHVAEAGAVVPGLWRIEVANAFQSALRRNRISATYHDASLGELVELPIAIDPDTDAHVWTETLRLAVRFGLTMYDATYLELAQRRNLPLATLDKELQEAASALDVTLLGPRGR
jgi:predicted nucleic acid-binding protein